MTADEIVERAENLRASLLKKAMRMGISNDAAHTAVQDAFLWLWKEHGRYDPKTGNAGLYKLLHQVVKLKAINLRVKEDRVEQHEERISDSVYPDRNGEWVAGWDNLEESLVEVREKVRWESMRASVRKLLSLVTLTDVMRTALEDWVEGIDSKVTAKRMGCSAQNVRNLRNDALNRLKEHPARGVQVELETESFLFLLMQHGDVYHAPTATGSMLAAEQLREMGQRDRALYATAIRKKQLREKKERILAEARRCQE